MHIALEGFTEAFSKEMLPEWNIKACILNPGGFKTGWCNAIITFDPHPAYAGNAANFHSLCSSITMLGDPAKGAQAIMKLSHKPKLLMHVQLGSNSLMVMKTKAEIVIRDVENFHEISRDEQQG